ncbi:hypothetical protein Vadar_010522 [Vaccinium darrowii]|uniref:Uncharacterized protein n=1 Tax=Vaccinium darrowii TaxID=229202 RepID=A0ACB7XGN5_9ERIC|nr:hypothetical protein Vadar_010522 [Vaccinium darrowii]
MTKGTKKSLLASTTTTLPTSKEVSNNCDESSEERRERKPKERVIEEDAPEPLRQVRMLKKTQPIPRKQEFVKKTQPAPTKPDSGDKGGLNPLAKEFRPSSSLIRLCNMEFILEEGLEAKDGQQQVMEGDVVELGETAKILSESMRPVDHVFSVTILEEEATKEVSKATACVMFEKPTPKTANHIKPLYISGCLDGMPVNCILIDGGSAANLMPRTTMTKLGKTEQDLIASSACLLDFKGGLTSWAKLYDSDIGPLRVANLNKYGHHKIVPLTSKSSTKDLKKAMLARFNAYLVDGRMMDLHEEKERPSSANAAEFIYEDEGMEEVDEADEGDVIRFEDLETAPAKLDDLKTNVQDPLNEINLGSEEEPKPVYIS